MPAFIEISVPTPQREALVDLTERIQEEVRKAAPGFSGSVSIFVPHTTAGVTMNEGADPAVRHDLLEGLARLAPRNAAYHHSEGNADAHLKAILVGNSVTVPCFEGRLRLGTWQSVYLAEFDGPRTRQVWITLASGLATTPPDTRSAAWAPTSEG